MNDKKKNGSYYTPACLVEFLVNYLSICLEGETKKLNILEPSCGDGIFIDYMLLDSLFSEEKHKYFLVEKDEKELNKIKDKYNDLKTNIQYSHLDYLDFHKENNEKYNLIIGNPPYINRKYMTEKQIISGEMILENANFNPSTIKNIWIAFLISSVESLTKDGTLCFVLPTEILQVKHSEKIRKYLLEKFELVEVFSFNEIIFEETEQDTVVIIGHKKSQVKGLKFNDVDKISDLKDHVYSSTYINNPASLDKWSYLFFEEEERNYINHLYDKMQKADHYCSSTVGIVTAANDYFIVNEDVKKSYKLESVSVPIIKRSAYIPKLINYTKNDFNNLMQSGGATNLLLIPKQIDNNKNMNVNKYLKIGIEKQIHERYKCVKRDFWYNIPSVWHSEAMFFKRCHEFPKIILNQAEVYTTDSAYRINMREMYSKKSFVFSFYNSLTFLFAELKGRFYGGGVLELTPNEFKTLPIPYTLIGDEEFAELDSMFRNHLDIETILAYTNQITLINRYGFSNDDVAFINKLYKKLLNKRLKRSKS